jgi:predicted nuclease with TOPRIM domain
MDVQDFCKGMEQEMTAWKAKLYDMNERVDKMGSKEKEHMLGAIGDLKIALTEMEERVEQLKRECPSDWSPMKKEIEDAHVNMRDKYNETLDQIGKGAPYSVPG